MKTDSRAAFPSQVSDSDTMQETAKYWIPHEHLATDKQTQSPNFTKTLSH